MALIKLGALAQDVRGSLVGTTYSKNKGGAYVRGKVSACQPVSNWSGMARSMFQSCAQKWSATLTDAQRAAWNAWAILHPIANVFGDSIILPGVAAFEMVNARLLQCGKTVLVSPPATFVVADLGGITPTMTVTGSALSLAIAAGRVLTATEGLYVLMTPPLGPARKLQTGDLRCLNTAGPVFFQLAFQMAGAIALRFPNAPWAVGSRVGLRVAAIDSATGAMSAAVGGVYVAAAP